jgi:hypothetical protein
MHSLPLSYLAIIDVPLSCCGKPAIAGAVKIAYRNGEDDAQITLYSFGAFFFPVLAGQQDLCALLYCICGLLLEDRIAVIANRVRNDGKRVSRHARDLGHHLRCRDETIGNDGCGPDTGLFGENGVVHTAR